MVESDGISHTDGTEEQAGMRVIEGFDSAVPIDRGWSKDEKYRVTRGGREYMLRVSPPERLESRRALFSLMSRTGSLGVPMCRAIELTERDGCAYTLLSWIDGEDAKDAIPAMDAGAQYALGLDAGRILRLIHGIPAPPETEPWAARYDRKLDKKLAIEAACPIRIEGGEKLRGYIAANRHLTEGRPQSFQHGDYHIGNMMLENGRLTIIDFDRYDWGDPWEEFNSIVWCAGVAPRFAAGRIDGYFDGRPPEEFFRLLALYIAGNALSSTAWAVPYGEKQIKIMTEQAAAVLRWFDDMNDPVPSWYRDE